VTGFVAPLGVVLVLEIAVLYRLRVRLDAVLRGTERAFDRPGPFARVAAARRAERFDAEPLGALVARLSSHTSPASKTIGRLTPIAGFVQALRNPLVALLVVPLLYPLQAALAAERWRRKHGAVVRTWVTVLGEFRGGGLASPAYAYEHPEDRLPELVDGPARFEAAALEASLIPASRCVRNDVTFGGDTRFCFLSARTCPARARCCARWASTPCWR